MHSVRLCRDQPLELCQIYFCNRSEKGHYDRRDKFPDKHAHKSRGGFIQFQYIIQLTACQLGKQFGLGSKLDAANLTQGNKLTDQCRRQSLHADPEGRVRSSQPQVQMKGRCREQEGSKCSYGQNPGFGPPNH